MDWGLKYLIHFETATFNISASITRLLDYNYLVVQLFQKSKSLWGAVVTEVDLNHASMYIIIKNTRKWWSAIFSLALSLN
jgi:hypothetical protein